MDDTSKTPSPPYRVPRIRVPIISFTVLVTVLYSLGFLALLVPIYRYYVPNLETALQAVSEVSRIVIIGRGIVAFGVPILGVSFVILIALLTGTRILRIWYRWGVLRAAYSLMLVAVTATITLLSSPQKGSLVVVFGIFAGVAALFATWFFGYAFMVTGFVQTRFFYKWSEGRADVLERALEVGIVLAILAIALSATPAAVLVSEPPLPSVTVVATEGGAEEPSNSATTEGNSTGENRTTGTGFLLGHSDGSWHILTTEGITAIPNGKVIKAEVS